MNRYSNLKYDVKSLVKYTLWIVFLALFTKFTKGFGAVILFPMAMISFSKNDAVGVLFAILMIIVGIVGNTYFFPKPVIPILITRATLVIAGFLIFTKSAGKRHSQFVTPFLGIFAYIFWECCVSCQGYAPVISYLKLILFSTVFLAYYAIANEVITAKNINPKKLRACLLSVAGFFILGSLLLKPFPGIGQMNTYNLSIEELRDLNSLFMGMTMHSQALGPTISILATLVFGDYLFSNNKFEKLYVGLLACSPFLIYWTSSRTAMGSYVVSLMIVFYFFLQERRIKKSWKSKMINVSLILTIVVSALVLCLPSGRAGIRNFVLKQKEDSGKQVTFEEFTSSRMGLVEKSMYYFRQKPFTGNGFQVSDDMINQQRGSLASYISAPIEKGFWPSAVLEEGGVPGLILFSGFLIIAFVMLVRRKAYVAASTLFSITIINLGEFGFFAMSFTGGLQWAIVFAGAALDAHRIKEQKMMNQQRVYHYWLR